MSLRSMQKMRNAWCYYLKRFFNTQDFTTCKNSQLKKLEYTKGVFKLLGEILKPKMGM